MRYVIRVAGLRNGCGTAVVAMNVVVSAGKVGDGGLTLRCCEVMEHFGIQTGVRNNGDATVSAARSDGVDAEPQTLALAEERVRDVQSPREGRAVWDPPLFGH